MNETIIKGYLMIAEYLTEKDETERALQVLNALPGLYRDHTPKEILSLKKLIQSKIHQAVDLVNLSGDNLKPHDFCKRAVENLARFKIVHQKITELNKEGIKPHIVDFGPGDYSLPIGLMELGADFTYNPIGLHVSAMSDAKNILERYWATYDIHDRPNFFLAYEIIEHLPNESDIRRMFDRIPKQPDMVFLSTPTYTFAEGNPKWKEIGCHHLRTYTPREFIGIAQSLFPEYNLSYIEDQVQVIFGNSRKG